MQGKNGLDIRNQQEKSYQNDELLFLGFEKVKKMQASVIEYFDLPSRPIYTLYQHIPPRR